MTIFLRILSYTWPFRLRVGLVLIAMAGSLAAAMAAPWLLGVVIDQGLASGSVGVLALLAGALLLASILRGAFGYLQNYEAESISQRVAYAIRRELYDRVQRLSFAYHDKAETGNLMSRATQDVEAVRFFISFGLIRLIYNAGLILVVVVLLLSVNWQLALLAFSILPLVAWRTIDVSRRLQPIYLRAQQGVGRLGTILQENLTGFRAVKAFRQEANQIRQFMDVAADVQAANLTANRWSAFNTPLLAFLLALGTAIILLYGGREVIEGRLTLGELVAFNAYLVLLALPVRSLGFITNIFTRGLSGGRRVFEVLDENSPVVEKPDAIVMPPVRGEVTFEHVAFGYDKASAVLKDVDFTVQPGQVVALLGATGSGKSTVVNLIPRFYDVTGGAIRIDGIDIRDVTLASLRANIGIVLQDNFLFSSTIRANIAYGAVDASEEDIVRAARAARIHDFIMSLEKGYDTWVGERGITLSGGQRQRIAIARTILLDPRILILDDSTSSVDMETEYLIQQALTEVMRGRTTFVIAQRLRTVRNADLILILRDGMVVAEGRHEELLERSPYYRELYDLQLRDQEEAMAGARDILPEMPAAAASPAQEPAGAPR